MLRIVIMVMVAVLGSGCAQMLADVQQAAQTRLQQFLASKFVDKLSEGIDRVVGDLAAEGGFLDDPLVRILLPPPLGLVIDVARDINADPKAVLLETLMNRAAENAIPVAGPILKDVLMNTDTETLQELLNSPRTAATAYLEEKGGAVIRQALLPGIARNLEDNGAVKLYGELLMAHHEANVAATAVETAAGDVAVVDSVAPEQLSTYVTEQAVGGLFKKMAVKEMAIRDSLDSLVESPL